MGVIENVRFWLNDRFFAEVITGPAALAALENQLVRAARFAGASEAMLARVGTGPTPVERRMRERFLAQLDGRTKRTRWARPARTAAA